MWLLSRFIHVFSRLTMHMWPKKHRYTHSNVHMHIHTCKQTSGKHTHHWTIGRPSPKAVMAMLQQKPEQLVLGLHHSTTCKAEELTATIQPGLHHTAIKWLFLASEFLLFGLFHFFPHTHHTTFAGMHCLLVTTQENERKVRKSLRKRRKTCLTIITHTHTHTHTHHVTPCTYHINLNKTWPARTHSMASIARAQ